MLDLSDAAARVEDVEVVAFFPLDDFVVVENEKVAEPVACSFFLFSNSRILVRTVSGLRSCRSPVVRKASWTWEKESGRVIVRADLSGHLKYSRRWSGVRAGVLLGAQGAVHRGENRGGL